MPVDIEKAKRVWPPTCHGRWMSEEYEPGLVSVIIPTYNRAHFLGEAMDSVWAQTYRPIEMLVVDDGSTDNTPQVLEDWGKRHSEDPQFELRYFHQENKGAPAARNLGLIESSGEFIQFLDADDFLLPDKLRQAVETIERSQVDFAYAEVAVSDDRLNLVPGERYGKPLRGHAKDVTAYTWPIMGPVYRRSVNREAGPWDEELAASQDWEYAARIKLLEYACCFDKRVGALFRQHGGARLGGMALRQRLNAWEKATDRVVNAATSLHKLDWQLRDCLSRLYFTQAVTKGRNGSLMEGDRCLYKAWKLSPPVSLIGLAARLLQGCRSTWICVVVDAVLTARCKLLSKLRQWRRA
jgi:glycosyltransferase involved in cell wall biosynthesis